MTAEGGFCAPVLLLVSVGQGGQGRVTTCLPDNRDHAALASTHPDGPTLSLKLPQQHATRVTADTLLL